MAIAHLFSGIVGLCPSHSASAAAQHSNDAYDPNDRFTALRDLVDAMAARDPQGGLRPAMGYAVW